MGETREGKASERDEQEILAFLRKIAEEELELEPEQIARILMDTPIVEGLKLDSLTQVVLITEIEEHYGIVFEPEDREKLETIQDLVEMIRSRATRERPA